MLANLIYVMFLIAGFPIGMILASLCRDEIRKWRVRLFLISIGFLFVSIAMAFTSFEYKFEITVASLFIIINCLTIIWRSYQEKRDKKSDRQDRFADEMLR